MWAKCVIETTTYFKTRSQQHGPPLEISYTPCLPLPCLLDFFECHLLVWSIHQRFITLFLLCTESLNPTSTTTHLLCRLFVPSKSPPLSVSPPESLTLPVSLFYCLPSVPIFSCFYLLCLSVLQNRCTSYSLSCFILFTLDQGCPHFFGLWTNHPTLHITLSHINCCYRIKSSAHLYFYYTYYLFSLRKTVVLSC